MSNFSSLDLDQPVEQFPLIDTFRQPIWIALFTSVIIHTILGINLQKLSVFSEKAKLPPTVGFVELTPEQLERLPQPKEPEITFSTIPGPGNFSLITPPTSSVMPFAPQSSSSELPTIPVDPSDYSLPKLPPLDSTNLSSPPPSVSTPSISRLPKNLPPREFSYTIPMPVRSPLRRTPIDPSPLPSASPPSTVIQPEPPQVLKESQIDEYQIRKSLNFTNEVYESGLSSRSNPEIDSTDEISTGENSTRKSYSANLKLPPQRYQDKVGDKTAITPAENNTDTQAQTKPLPPDPTKKNRLPEAPIVSQLREGNTIQEIAEEIRQQKAKLTNTKKFSDVPPVAKRNVTELSSPVQLLKTTQQKKPTNATTDEKSQSRTDALDASYEYITWATELKVAGESFSLTKPKTISDIYPEAACEQRLKGQAMVGLLVGPDGSISEGPKLLLKSGYSMLDKAALDAVSKESFNSSNKSKLYQYEFNFDSSNCSS
ncbi:MAG: energy transducer TonB [Trichodesmium sp. MAG_R04]|nr:energy transducer TonB [Trichodesmium sp. MAG_R04]